MENLRLPILIHLRDLGEMLEKLVFEGLGQFFDFHTVVLPFVQSFFLHLFASVAEVLSVRLFDQELLLLIVRGFRHN